MTGTGKALLKIEDVAVEPIGNGGRGKGAFREFVLALKALKRGQSFVWEMSSNDRMAIAIVQILLDRQFITRREGDSFRVGRLL